MFGVGSTHGISVQVTLHVHVSS